MCDLIEIIEGEKQLLKMRQVTNPEQRINAQKLIKSGLFQ